MKFKIRVAIGKKKLKRFLGLFLLSIPFFFLLSAFNSEKIRDLLTQPYWKRALGERAKRVPQFKEEKETVEEIREGTLSNLPLYHLYIKPNTLEEIEELLPKKKEHEPWLGILLDRARIYKPAVFEYKGKQWPVRTRLRGDTAIHWGGRKQSWRIKFTKEEPFNGARRIDLINPKATNLLTDYLAMWLAKRMGLLAPEIEFINLKINHKLMGVYQQTEHIDKYFLENHGRTAGNIYGEQDKKPNWYEVYPIYTDVAFWRKHCKSETQAPSDYTEIERFVRILNDPSDEVFVEEIFKIVDKDKFYRWNCHALLSSSVHQDWFHNARLYFDPTRALFEFIPWDVGGFSSPRQYFFDTFGEIFGRSQYNPMFKRVLEHGQFRYERDCLLWSFVKDPAFLDEITGEAERMRCMIRAAVYNDSLKEDIRNFPLRTSFTNEEFEESCESLKRVTRTTFNRIREALQFNDLKIVMQLSHPEHVDGDTEGTSLVKLGFVNSASTAAVLKNISLPIKPEASPTISSSALLYLSEDTNNNNRLDSSDHKIADFEWNQEESSFSCGGFQAFVYPEVNEKLQPISTRKDFFIVRSDSQAAPPFGINQAEFRVENAVTGEQIEHTVQVIDNHLHGMDIPMPRTAADFLVLYPNLRCTLKENARIAIESGEHRIAKTLVIPQSATLEIPSGTTLKFAPGCSLMCYGRLEAKGTPNSPIRFTADETQQGWGVVALCRSGANGSVLDHCIFEYGGEAQIYGGYFSGALSAYHAAVRITNCSFLSNRGDDAINCKYADSSVEKCVFAGNAADAIDFDYCEGAITDCRIASSGNDGIDCGTANPLIMGNLITDSGDKGISVGEESLPLIVNNVIRNCPIGVASKDMSNPVIVNNVIWNNATGISLYRKKPKYPDGGRGSIANCIIWGGKKRIEKDRLSVCQVAYCSIEGGYPGQGNVNISPDFIHPDSGNYLLKAGSALSKAGTDPEERARELLGLLGNDFPIGLAKPLNIPETPSLGMLKR